MTAHRLLASASGVMAVTLPTILSAFLVVFAVRLYTIYLSISILAIIAAVLTLLWVGLLVTTAADRFWPRQTRAARTLLLVAGSICFLATVATITTLSWMCTILAQLPVTIVETSTRNLLYAAFVVWAMSLVCQCLFLASSLQSLRQMTTGTQMLGNEEGSHNSSEMQDCSRIRTPEAFRYESMSPPSTAGSGRKRSSSEAFNEFRSSISKVVRPISSKTRLVSLKSSYRSPSLDSGTGVSEAPLEDAFDTWDIDPATRQSLAATFPFPPPPPTASSTANSPHPSGTGRFLETIPASPTGSRSNSPGFPLDLEPPRPLNRSRSRSPASSVSSRPRRSRAASPSSLASHNGINSESHIHPLFRSDSPEPPPSTTPNTVITAAPGAGQIIADRQTIRRMRSGSLPTTPSPLANSSSLDVTVLDHRLSLADSDASGSTTREPTTSPPEREMTPPIPDWILGAGPRTSMYGYNRRKVSGPGGLGAVGEVGEH